MKNEQITSPTKTQPKPSDYLEALDGEDLTEKQKSELLEALFNIMSTFVERGFGAAPVSKLHVKFQKPHEPSHDQVESQNETKDGCDG